MTRRQIDEARERRLWFSQVIVPTAMTVATIMAVPEVRKAAVDKYHQVKEAVQRKFKK